MQPQSGHPTEAPWAPSHPWVRRGGARVCLPLTYIQMTPQREKGPWKHWNWGHLAPEIRRAPFCMECGAGRGDGKFSPQGKGVELLWASVFTKVLPPNSGPALWAQVTGSTTATVNKRTRETGTDVDLISEAPQPLVSSRGPPHFAMGKMCSVF